MGLSMDNSVGIIIADYSQFQLRAMENLISQTNGLHLIYATTNGDDLLQKLPQYQPRVIITDLELQGTSGLEMCRVTQKQYPHIGMMIFTMHGKCYMARQAFKAGVLGFLKKDTTEDEIIRCIQDVSLGHLHICPPYSELGRKVLMEGAEPNQFQLLVLNLLCIGFITSQIAELIPKSGGSVTLARTRLYEISGTNNEAELGVWAERNGYIWKKGWLEDWKAGGLLNY